MILIKKKFKNQKMVKAPGGSRPNKVKIHKNANFVILIGIDLKLDHTASTSCFKFISGHFVSILIFTGQFITQNAQIWS